MILLKARVYLYSGDHSALDNYRPITLSPIWRKCLNIVLCINVFQPV